MGWFSGKSKKPVKRLSKVKQLERRVDNDDDYSGDGDYTADIPDSSEYVTEFKEGIDEIIELFMSSESGGDKFGKLSFGLANLCNYRNVIFEDLVGGGMSEKKADAKLKHVLIDAGFSDMMLEVVSFRETKKPRGRKKKASQ